MRGTLDRSPTAEAHTKSKALGCSFVMLGHGKFALIDNEDTTLGDKYLWHFNLRGYAARLQHIASGKSCAIVYLHRSIMGDIKGVTYDHINRNKLDCRRANLRAATQSQNSGNVLRRKTEFSTSQYKGVSFDRGKQRFLAQGRSKGKMVFIGRFKDETDAAMAYNRWAQSYFGEFAFLNPV